MLPVSGGLRIFEISRRYIPPAIDAQVTPADLESQAVAALVALGYKPQEASRMVSKVASAGADCEMLIRDALRAAL